MSLRQAILGFLDLEPTTGYTLGQRFSGSVGSFWSATQSQIYRELHDLERARLAQVEVIPQPGKPPRKVYSLTAEGRAELARLLAAPIEPVALREPFLLKFVFSANLPPEELDQALARQADELERRRGEYRERLSSPQIFSLARSEREALLWRLSLQNGLSWCEAQLSWLAQARQELAPRRGPERAASERAGSERGKADKSKPAPRRKS